MKIFYFTGTGNSLYIAKQLSDNLYSIPQVLKGKLNIFEDEQIGIIFPTYALSVPTIVEEFLHKVKLISPYIFTIMTCAHGNGDANRYLSKLARQNNIEISFSTTITMVGNHIPLTNLSTEIDIDKNVESQIINIKSLIECKQRNTPSGNLLNCFIRNVLRIIHFIFPDNCKKYVISNQCINCGTCIKVCPRNNISQSAIHPIFSNNCEGCQSCVHNCPKQAIQIPRDKCPNIRYRNPNIKLSEIIISNSQT